jgi:hypothetical protein
MSTGIHVLLIDSHDRDRFAERPEIPVCRANEARSHRISGARAEERGVQGMQKGGTSGDVLDQTIATIATVPREKYRNPVRQEQPYRCS